MQVVSVDDVAETVALCLAPRAPLDGHWDARASAGAHARRHRHRAARLARLSAAAAVAAAARRRCVAIAASPTCSASSAGAARRARPRCAQLAAGVVGDPAAWIAATGICAEEPRRHPGRAAGERRRTAGSRGSICSSRSPSPALALFWIADRRHRARSRPRGGDGASDAGRVFAWLAELIAGSSGALLRLSARRCCCWCGRLRAPVLLIMLAVTRGLSRWLGTVLAPQLWLDPLGPLT